MSKRRTFLSSVGGTGLFGFVLLWVFFSAQAGRCSAEWSPPVGIPDPGFGITESHYMYAGKTYTYGSTVGPYKDAGNGPYTHYVDNTSLTATDTNNPYGDAAKPRRSFPTAANIAPGAVIEVHGGPYDWFHYYFTANGEAERPIFLRGPSFSQKPIFTGKVFMIRSHYVIVENFEMVNAGFDIRPWYDYEKVHHVTVRHSEIRSGDGAKIGASSYVAGNDVFDVVVYNNKIHPDNFDPNGGEFPEKDIGGFYAGRQSHRSWVLDNDIYGMSGDGIGGCHGCNYTATDLYVGRNTIHDTGENAVDFKEIENVVVSQNKMYGFKGLSSGSGGGAVVIHYGPTYSPKNAWFLFNEIYDCTDTGIQVGGDQVHESYFIGNIVHDIHNAAGTGKGFSTWSSNKINLIGNIFYNIDNGIDGSGTINGPNEQLAIYNNIISSVRPGGFHIKADDSTYRNAMEMDNNIFYQPDASVKFVWGTTYDGLAKFRAATGKCPNCFEIDPLFSDPASRNFQLTSNSPGIDKGTTTDLYDRFKTLFGVDIKVDYLGQARPQGTAFDIGPYEYKPGGGDAVAPKAPGGVTVW